MTLPVYATGTVSVSNLGTVVTGTGGMWSGINAREGDFFTRPDGVAVITEVTDATHLKITPWPGATVAGGPYAITQNYVGRVVGVAAAEDVGIMLEKLHVDGLPFIVGADETVPDPSYGDEGQLAFKPETGEWWVKSGGIWVPSAGIGFGDAPGDGVLYGRKDFLWEPVPDNTIFTQAGTGAVPVTLNDLLQDKVFTPEMFGAEAVPVYSVPPYGYPASSSIPDSTAAVQAALNHLKAIGGGTLQFGPGVYSIKLAAIAGHNIFIKGAGVNATTIYHNFNYSGASGTTLFDFSWSSGASILSNTGISDLTIAADDMTFTKVAIGVTDCSFFTATDINILSYPPGLGGGPPAVPPYGGYFSTSKNGYGFVVRGREHINLERCQVRANKPLRIDSIPAYGTGFNFLDSSTFRNCLFETRDADGCCVTIAPGGALNNVHFDGHQNWIGGVHGLSWDDGATAAAVALDVSFSGIKGEQVTTGGGYTFYINRSADTHGLRIADSMAGDRNGVYLRNVSNATINNFYFNAAAGPTKIGLNIDSTDKLVELIGCTWVATTIATIGSGLTLIKSSGFQPTFSTALPSTGTYIIATGSTGYVGQYVEFPLVSTSAVTLTSGGFAVVGQIDLPPGDWDVNAIVYHLPAAGTSYTRYVGAISATGSFETEPGKYSDFTTSPLVTGGNTLNNAIPLYRFNLSALTTIYLLALGVFTVSTAKAYGLIRARRVR